MPESGHGAKGDPMENDENTGCDNLGGIEANYGRKKPGKHLKITRCFYCLKPRQNSIVFKPAHEAFCVDFKEINTL